MKMGPKICPIHKHIKYNYNSKFTKVTSKKNKITLQQLVECNLKLLKSLQTEDVKDGFDVSFFETYYGNNVVVGKK